MIANILYKSVTFKYCHIEYIGYVCDIVSRYEHESFIGRVEALGWGTTSFGGTVSTKLQKVTLDVVENAQCQNAYPDTPITSAQICTYTPDKDTCGYDSGNEHHFVPISFQGIWSENAFNARCLHYTC